MIRRPPRSTRKESSAASDVYKRQGSFGLLGASVSRLFAALGPLMIAFTILAPFLPALARGTGLVTKESQALNKSYSALSEQASKLDERFEIQTQSIQNTKLAYVETRKAILAFNKTCLLYTSPSPRDAHESRMPSSA